MLFKLFPSVERYQDLFEAGKLQKKGMRGLDYSNPFHVLDEIGALQYSCVTLLSKILANCWIEEALFLPNSPRIFEESQ